MEEEDLRPIDSIVKSKVEEHTKKFGRKEKMLSMLKLYPDGVTGSELFVKCNMVNNGSAYSDLKLLEARGLITIKDCQCGQGKIYKIK
jgi:hypothetical protein